MFGRIRVDRFGGAAVHGQGSLAIAVEIQAPHHHRALHWFLEDSGAHFVTFPDDSARYGHVERNKFHCDILAVLVVFKCASQQGAQARVPVPLKGRGSAAEKSECQSSPATPLTSLPAVQHCCTFDAICFQIIQGSIGFAQRKESDLAADRNFGSDTEEIL